MTAALEQHVHDQLDALCGNAGRVALGYSGGGDSHALMLLAADWARSRGVELLALTVDHGFRPESASEAQHARSLARKQGLEARMLTCRKDKLHSAIQETARTWRHDALSEACNLAGITRLLLAHTRDDQAETVLMRLQAGARWQGLAGMGVDDVSPSWPLGREIRLGRPLLSLRRRDLREWLTRRGEAWIEDPSNENTRFTRIRLRQALHRAGDGPGQRLADLAFELGQARHTVRKACAELMPQIAEVMSWGGVRLDAGRLAKLAPLYRRGLLGLLVQAVSGSTREVGSNAVFRLEEALARSTNTTAGGIMLQVTGQSAWMVRDPGAVLGRVDHPARSTAVVTSQNETVWDGRLLHPSDECPEPLGLDYSGLVERDALAEIPGFARASLPCFRRNGRVISIPGLLGADSVDCRFLVSDRLESRLSACDPSFLSPRTSLISQA